MQLTQFDFDLPTELIARFPQEKRDHSRLMVVNRQSSEIQQDYFFNLRKYLRGNEFFVFNSSRVVSARLFGRIGQALIECLLIRFFNDQRAEVFIRPARKAVSGAEIVFENGISARVMERSEMGKRIIEFNCDQSKIYDAGYAPLPPYIKRTYQQAREWRDFDRQRYQTVYADRGRSIAAPTAGLHFSEEILNEMRKEFPLIFLRLHVGEATFQKIRTENITEHRVLSEDVEIDFESWRLINELKKKQRKLLAVGTTTVRAIESAFRLNEFTPRFTTDLYIYPGFQFKAVDLILTNFHLPKSSLFIMISAFCGLDLLKKAYQSAIENRYRFFSYGDCMLII